MVTTDEPASSFFITDCEKWTCVSETFLCLFFFTNCTAGFESVSASFILFTSLKSGSVSSAPFDLSTGKLAKTFCSQKKKINCGKLLHQCFRNLTMLITFKNQIFGNSIINFFLKSFIHILFQI